MRAHKHPKVRAWLARHPRWTFHFTPTSCSWLNAVEGFFATLTKRRLRRGSFGSLVELQAAINRYLAEHNTDPRPFVWTAEPDGIIEKVRRGYQASQSVQGRPSSSGKQAEEGLLSDPQACGKSGHEGLPQGSLLLVESTSRPDLGCCGSGPWRSRGCRDGGEGAAQAACNGTFAHALVDVRFRYRNTLDLIRIFGGRQSELRIVVITDHDSFATVVLALRAGADDYLPIPVSEHELADALLGRGPPLPPIPETPLGADRIRWEHTQRILTQCGRNVSDTARRLRMHRRTLQRLLSKRAPYLRGSLQT